MVRGHRPAGTPVEKKKSDKDAGRSEDRAEEIAARAVNKEEARSGESKTSSRSSTRGHSAGAES
jgi:hypothetical protein